MSREGTSSDSHFSRDDCVWQGGSRVGSSSMLEAKEAMAEAGGASWTRGHAGSCWDVRRQSRRDWPLGEWRREDKWTSPRFPECDSQSPLRIASSFLKSLKCSTKNLD